MSQSRSWAQQSLRDRGLLGLGGPLDVLLGFLGQQDRANLACASRAARAAVLHADVGAVTVRQAPAAFNDWLHRRQQLRPVPAGPSDVCLCPSQEHFGAAVLDTLLLLGGTGRPVGLELDMGGVAEDEPLWEPCVLQRLPCALAAMPNLSSLFLRFAMELEGVAFPELQSLTLLAGGAMHASHAPRLTSLSLAHALCPGQRVPLDSLPALRDLELWAWVGRVAAAAPHTGLTSLSLLGLFDLDASFIDVPWTCLPALQRLVVAQETDGGLQLPAAAATGTLLAGATALVGLRELTTSVPVPPGEWLRGVTRLEVTDAVTLAPTTLAAPWLSSLSRVRELHVSLPEWCQGWPVADLWGRLTEWSVLVATHFRELKSLCWQSPQEYGLEEAASRVDRQREESTCAMLGRLAQLGEEALFGKE